MTASAGSVAPAAEISGAGDMKADAVMVEGTGSSSSASTGSAWGASFGQAPRSSILRDHADEAVRLTRFLSRVMSQELAKQKDKGENDPEARELIDFLTAAVAILDNIADEIQAAKVAPTAEQKEQRLQNAETWVESLADATRGFAERNHDRIIDAGGYTAYTFFNNGTLYNGLRRFA